MHTAYVLRVIDGDTIAVQVDGATQTMRLMGVDTPETKHPTRPAAFADANLTAQRSVWMSIGLATGRIGMADCYGTSRWPAKTSTRGSYVRATVGRFGGFDMRAGRSSSCLKMRRGRKGAACGISADLDGKLPAAVQGNGPPASGPFRAVGQGD